MGFFCESSPRKSLNTLIIFWQPIHFAGLRLALAPVAMEMSPLLLKLTPAELTFTADQIVPLKKKKRGYIWWMIASWHILWRTLHYSWHDKRQKRWGGLKNTPLQCCVLLSFWLHDPYTHIHKFAIYWRLFAYILIFMSLIYLPGLGCTYSQHENKNKIYLPPSPGPAAAVISVLHTSPSLAPFLPFMNHLSAEVNVKKILKRWGKMCHW